MPEWRRRQILLTALGVGSMASGLGSVLRRSTILSRQAELTTQFLNSPQAVEEAVTRAIEGDIQATAEVQRILSGLNLTAPPNPYERSISKTLILASRLATEQYLTGKFNLRYRGAIDTLPSFGERLAGYMQVASIKGPDMATAERQVPLNDRRKQDPLLAEINLIRSRIQGVASQALVEQWSYPVYWGFVLTCPEHHILVLRGTQRGHEWLQTLNAKQIASGDVPTLGFRGRVHRGFATIYGRLSNAIIEAVQQLDVNKPLYLSGHSLGAPLASLAALDISQKVAALRRNLRLYTYASPRLGDPTFAEAFNSIVPNAYRVINQADLVPNLPPTSAANVAYVHAGEQWAFTSAAGDIGPNHFISAYRHAIENEMEQRAG